MGNTSSTIRIIFDGTTAGIERAARRARTEIDALEKSSDKTGKKLDAAFGKVGRGALGITALTGSTQVLVGALGALGQLAPSALLLPGAISELGAVFATAKIGLSGFGDAVKSGDLSKLAPQARDTAAAVRGLAPAFDGVRKSVQNTLFAGFAADVKTLGAGALPVLKAGLTGIAGPLNSLGKGLLEAVSSNDALSDLSGIFTNTKTSLSGLHNALGDVVTGFLKLGAFGTSYFGGLGKAIEGAANKFAIFVSNGVETGSFARSLTNVGAALRQMGDIAGNVGRVVSAVFTGLAGPAGIGGFLGSLDKVTAALATFAESAQGQGALRALGDAFRTISDVTRTVLLTALEQIAPILIDLGPTVQTVATTIGSFLVSAIKIAGPLLDGLAKLIAPFAQVFGDAGAGVLVFYAALKISPLLAALPAFFSGLSLKIVALGEAARVGAAGPIALAAGLAAIAGVIGLGIVADQLDKVNLAAAKGDPAKLDDMSRSLHNIVGGFKEIASGNFGQIFDEIGAQFSTVVEKFETGTSDIGKFFGDLRRQIEDIHLTPIKVTADGSQARGDIERLIGEVNRSSATVNINGNDNPAAFALREIISEINSGKAEILIDGQNRPAQDALNYVIGLINNGSGSVNIDGQDRPAGQVLSELLRQIDTTVGTVTIDGDTNKATGKISQTVTLANGSVGTITVDGNPDPATGKINGTITYANGQTGTVQIDGNQTPAEGKINAVVTYADGRTGTIQVNANTGNAQGVIDSFIRTNDGRTITIYTSVLGSGGIASAGRLAAGGPVRGPGSGTSDTAGLFALSNGEHVWTAAEVRKAGGQAAVARLRRAVAGGQIPRLANGGAIPPGLLTPLTPVPTGGGAAQPVHVTVMLDGKPFAALVDTRIGNSARQTRRTVSAGSGTTY